MSDRLIVDLRSADHIEAIRRLKKCLDQGGGDPIGLRLSGRLAVVGVSSVLERRGWRARKYQAGDDHLVLGSPPGCPPITVWHGPAGWRLRRSDDESRDNAPEPLARLVSETVPAAGGAAAESGDEEESSAALSNLTAIIIGGDSMGYGNSEVGRKLLLTYFDILTAMAAPPEVMFFYNSASRLTSQPSALLPAIKDLALQGADILTSSLCLERLGLGDKLKVGRKSNMYELVNIISTYGNVIYL